MKKLILAALAVTLLDTGTAGAVSVWKKMRAHPPERTHCAQVHHKWVCQKY